VSHESDSEPAPPLLCTTPRHWAELAAARLPVFLADHAVCEQQAALNALALIGQYPADAELVERLTALAIEETHHLRRVAALLHARGLAIGGKRANAWVQALRTHIRAGGGPELRMDRLLVAALIEARSSERFARLREVLTAMTARDARRDPADGTGVPEAAASDLARAVVELLDDLAPAEERHWQMFHALAARDVAPARFAHRWREWLEIERDLAATTGVAPTVHG
jgi:tRNA-(ms[2]io[6]A)-hydroxylase